MNTIPNPQQLFGKKPSHVQPASTEHASGEVTKSPVHERPEIRECELGNAELPIAQYLLARIDDWYNAQSGEVTIDMLAALRNKFNN